MIEWFVSSSVLILVMIALRQIFKGRLSPMLQYALWGLVLIRLLLPFSFGMSRVSVMNLFPGPTQNASISDLSPDIPVVPSDLEVPGGIPGSTSGQETTATQGQGISDELPINKGQITFAQTARLVWLLGVAATGFFLLVSNLKFARELRKTRNRLDRGSGVLPVYETNAVSAPCMFGLISPAIYVTPELSENEVALGHVLEHETTHFRHKDHFWSLFRCVCLALHWYNPFVWWAASLSIQDAELACDEATIGRIGESERIGYGRTLIGLTCSGTGTRAVFSTATSMNGGKESIKERITFISKKPKMTAYAFIIVLLVAAIAGGCTFTKAGKKADENVILYERAGVKIAIPKEHAEELLVDPAKQDNETVLLSVYEKGSYETHNGMGWLFSIVRYTEGQYEQFLCSDGSGQSFFAKDKDNAYYGFFVATDMPVMPNDFQRFSELLTAVGSYVKNDMITRNGLTAYSSSSEPQAPLSPAELFAASTGSIHDYMPDLIAGVPVKDYELLPCLENFTHSTWNELNKQYGGPDMDWFNPFFMALKSAAISGVSDLSDQFLRDYYVGKAFLASDGAYSESLENIAAMQWVHNPALYSECLKERFSKIEEQTLRSHIMYSMYFEDEGTFSLQIPGATYGIYLGPNPFDFPFGLDLPEISRESHRAESFGNVIVVESDELQVSFLHNTQGVYHVITVRTTKSQHSVLGVAVGDSEQSVLARWPNQLVKVVDGLSYDDEAWFGTDYDFAYVYSPMGSIKSTVFLMKDGTVSGILLINGLDGSPFPGAANESFLKPYMTIADVRFLMEKGDALSYSDLHLFEAEPVLTGMYYLDFVVERGDYRLCTLGSPESGELRYAELKALQPDGTYATVVEDIRHPGADELFP